MILFRDAVLFLCLDVLSLKQVPLLLRFHVDSILDRLLLRKYVEALSPAVLVLVLKLLLKYLLLVLLNQLRHVLGVDIEGRSDDLGAASVDGVKDVPNVFVDAAVVRVQLQVRLDLALLFVEVHEQVVVEDLTGREDSDVWVLADSHLGQHALLLWR